MRVQMRTEISKLRQQLSSTMIYVTHDQVEAMTMGDRIVVMKDGLIQQVDEPLALYDNPKNMFVAGFIGSPPMNFFKGIIEQRAGGIWFVEAGKGSAIHISDNIAGKLAGHLDKPVVFGCRPEDINEKAIANFARPNQSVSATVEIVEPMGAEVYIYLTTGAHSFIARVNTHHRAEVGQKLEMAFDMQKSHFFDGATEKLII